MNEFAHLLDRLAYEPRRNAKLRLLQDYFTHAPDPERGYALAAMTGGLRPCPSMRWKFGVELERPSVRRPEVELL